MLNNNGFSKTISKYSAKLTGGRLIYLIQSIDIKNSLLYATNGVLLNQLQWKLFELARADAEKVGLAIGNGHFACDTYVQDGQSRRGMGSARLGLPPFFLKCFLQGQASLSRKVIY